MSKLVDTRSWELDRKKGGRALRELMEQRGVTQDELAEASGVPKTLISRLWWGGTEKPGLEMVVRLWGALGLPPSRAAQDYGVYPVSTDPIQDPRVEEVRAMIYSLPKDEREDLMQLLHFTAQVYMQRYVKQAG